MTRTIAAAAAVFGLLLANARADDDRPHSVDINGTGSHSVNIPYSSFAAPEVQALPIEQQQYQQEKAQCNEAPLTPANAVQRQDCVNKSLTYHALRSGVPDSIIYQRTTSDTQAAVAYSQGRITASEYQRELAQSEAIFIRTGESYLNAQQQQQQSSSNINWGALQYMGAGMMANSAPPGAVTGTSAIGRGMLGIQNTTPPPPPGPTNYFCVPINGGVSCNRVGP